MIGVVVVYIGHPGFRGDFITEDLSLENHDLAINSITKAAFSKLDFLDYKD